MKRSNIKIALILILFIIEMFSLFLMVKSFNNKDLEKIKEEHKVTKKQFSIYVKNDQGNYEEYIDGNLFPLGYQLNLKKSNCIDSKKNIVDGVLTFSNNKVTITSNKSIYCYLYFDEGIKQNTLGSSIYNIDSDNINEEAGLFRYQGTNEEVTNNYICFGTSDLNTCKNSPGTYMYRIIGITKEGQLKLIKKEALDTTYRWYSSNTSDVAWTSSQLYTGLNTSSFVNNSSYLYMKEVSEWYSKIENINWNYGTVTDEDASAENIYAEETNFSNTISAKIGLMYIHDYYYGLKGGNNCSSSGDYESCMTSWIYLKNNDSSAPNSNEQLLARASKSGSNYPTYIISITGFVTRSNMSTYTSVRPVMYIKASEVLKDGIGTSENPYLLEGNEVYRAGLEIKDSKPSNLSTSTVGGLYRYQGSNSKVTNNYICFGTSDMTKCKNNPETYMYRIIGIESTGRIKVIKKEALNTGYMWHNDRTTDTTWPDSDIYKGLNNVSGGLYSSLFINSPNYPYMKSNTDWYKKITNKSWKYGDITTNASTTGVEVYNIENAWTTTTGARIGMLYLHDYYLANDNSTNFYTTENTTNWLNINNNDLAPVSSYERIMSRYTYSTTNTINYGWAINSSTGKVVSSYVTGVYSIRPVFYINFDEILKGGTGTESNPYMLYGSEYDPSLGVTIQNKDKGTSGLNSALQGGLYRYQGTDVANYICFGTSVKSTCLGNTDKYLYRIIGIDETGLVKVIKKEALNSAMQWDTQYSTIKHWNNSLLYTNINGTAFLTNYLTSTWRNKIYNYSWKYNIGATNYGSASEIYEKEEAWTNTISAKIGLMHISDFHFAYQSGGLNCGDSSNYNLCKQAWIHLSNNDTSAPNTKEWTMDLMGNYQNNGYSAYFIRPEGYAYDYTLNSSGSVRPVFYINSTNKFSSGSGTSSDPYIIS